MLESGLGRVPLSALTEWNRNPRNITDEKLAMLTHALAEDPAMMWARPLIATPAGEVFAGNMRLRAARALGWEAIPTFVVELDDARKREWALRDNSGYGEWIPEELAALVLEHDQADGDLTLLGLSESEADGLLALIPSEGDGRKLGDPDATPPVPVEPQSRPGDVYRLGEHTLACADASSAESYALLIEHGERAGWDAVWTDPPYGVAYNPENRESYFSPARLARPLGEVIGDGAVGVDAYAEWLTVCLDHAGDSLREGGAVYLCHADKMVEAASRAFRETGLYFSSQILWLKTVLVFGRSDYHYKHEPILYGWKSGAAHRWFGDRTQTTVIEAASDHYNEHKTEDTLHGNQKPFALIRPMLQNSTQEGDVVLDPFGGSGSTLIVAESLGRRCAMLELDPRFCDVVCARWEAYADGTRELVHRVKP